MITKGLKVNVLGDSITYGVGASAPDRYFVNVLKELCEFDVLRPYGLCGSRFAKQTVPHNGKTQFDVSFIDRAPTMDKDADLVLVFGGVNDFLHGDAPMGETTDRDDSTFYGACHQLMSTLLSAYPQSTVVFITPYTVWAREYTPVDKVLDHYVSAIKTVARHYNLPVLDLAETVGFSPNVPEQKALYLPDALHPTDKGHQRIAERIAGFLKAL